MGYDSKMRNLDPVQLAVLIDYSEGRLLTRDTIEKLGLDDYADLIIELSQRDLPFPQPQESEARMRSLALATAILQPLLRLDVEKGFGEGPDVDVG
jgi:hypothetical protein